MMNVIELKSRKKLENIIWRCRNTHRMHYTKMYAGYNGDVTYILFYKQR